MRVISQKGEFDFPYEQIVVQRNENIVFAIPVSNGALTKVLGEYGTPEQAEKAMDMLHEVYMGKFTILQNIDIDEAEFEKVKSSFGNLLFVRSDDSSSRIIETNERLFRFPQDCEVQL